MEKAIYNPLNETHLAELNRVLERCAANKELIGKCIDSGLDFQEAHAQNEQHAAMAEKIKRHFFPNNP